MYLSVTISTDKNTFCCLCSLFFKRSSCTNYTTFFHYGVKMVEFKGSSTPVVPTLTAAVSCFFFKDRHFLPSGSRYPFRHLLCPFRVLCFPFSIGSSIRHITGITKDIYTSYSSNWARTSDILINSQALYQLSYRGLLVGFSPLFFTEFEIEFVVSITDFSDCIFVLIKTIYSEMMITSF